MPFYGLTGFFMGDLMPGCRLKSMKNERPTQLCMKSNSPVTGMISVLRGAGLQGTQGARYSGSYPAP